MAFKSVKSNPFFGVIALIFSVLDSNCFLAKFVVAIVSQLDLSAIKAKYKGHGKPAYRPEMMIALILYAYMTGTSSSRAMARNFADSVSYNYICNGEHPDHSTISRFRKRFGLEIDNLFRQVLKIASEWNLIDMSACFDDGTKMKANASIHHAYSYAKVKQLREKTMQEIKILEEENTKSDDYGHSINKPDIDISDELTRRYRKLEAMDRAIEGIEKRHKEQYNAQMEEYKGNLAARKQKENETGKKPRGKVPSPPKEVPNDKDQFNLTDSDSRVMPIGTKGFIQGYNCQACAEPKSMIILGAYATQNPNDKREIKPMLRELDKNYDSLGKPEAMVADTGYFSEENVKACEEEGIEPYMATGRIPHNPPLEKLSPPKELPESSSDISSKDKMRKKLNTKDGKEIYKKRKQVIEPVFGIIKESMKFRQFRLRGIENVNMEWKLVCMAYNIKMIFNKLSSSQPDFLKQFSCQNS
jgi:transposase